MNNYYQAIVSGLIDSLWIMGIAWILFLFTSHQLKPTPSQRHDLATVLFGMGFSAFILCIVLHYNYPAGSMLLLDRIAGNGLHYGLSQWAAYGYFLLFLIHFFILAFRFQQLHKIKQVSAAPHEWLEHIEKWSAEFGLKTNVVLKLTGILNGPATYGFLKPVILIPASCLTNMRPGELECLIKHELAHIKRHDYLIQMLLEIARCILFFNPFVYLFIRSIKKDSEKACDDLVMLHGTPAILYANALVRIAEWKSNFSLAIAATGKETHSEFYERILRLIGKDSNRTRFPLKPVLFALSVILFVLLVKLFTTQKYEFPKEKLHVAYHKELAPKATFLEIGAPAFQEIKVEDIPATEAQSENFESRISIHTKEFEQAGTVAGIDIEPALPTAPVAEPIVVEGYANWTPVSNLELNDVQKAAQAAYAEAKALQETYEQQWLEELKQFELAAEQWKDYLDAESYQNFRGQIRADLNNEVATALLQKLKLHEAINSVLVLNGDEYREMEKLAASLKQLKADYPEFFQKVKQQIPHSRFYFLDGDSLPRVRVIISL